MIWSCEKNNYLLADGRADKAGPAQRSASFMARFSPQLRLISLPQASKPFYDLDVEVDKIHDLASFTRFLRELRGDFHDGDEEWANDDLEQFLSGLNGAADDLQAFRGASEAPSWRRFARLLLAATVRE
jgi:hypothetical protein